jgi:hypothetical protein
MGPNLQEQYEQIEELVGEYRSFIQKIIWRGLRPRIYIRFMMLFLKGAVNSNGASPSERRRELIKRVVEMVYSAEERKNPFCEIGVGPHSLHKLSCLVERTYPNTPFEHLIKMQEISDIRINAWKPAKLFGFVLAAGSLFLKTVPQPLVESFRITYASYQIVVFWVTVAVLAYVSLIIAIWYGTGYKQNQVSKLTKEVIEYTAARIKAGKTGESVQPPADSVGVRDAH